ncbi:MAG: asparagine synthase [Candidatus Aminicenantes bacterium]|nr:MAG: asparagine synthase [Candidatus Aminicenantes bacterium]
MKIETPLLKQFNTEFDEMLAKDYLEDSTYDYLVLFSGGKDSTYLAHRLKKAKGGRVCLFTIDNGFEDDHFLETAREGADMLKMDLYIHRPVYDELTHYYKYIITEPALKEIDDNPLCFFCSRLFMGTALRFAQRNQIPFVIYGATPEQLKLKKRDTARDIAMFQFMLGKKIKSIYKKVRQTHGYINDPLIRKYVDQAFYSPDSVKLIFPFIYLSYNVQAIKEELQNVFHWKNPVEGLADEYYLTSGCKLIKLLGLFQEKFDIKPHELNQFQADFEKGVISKQVYDYNVKYYNELMEFKKTPETEKLLTDLGLEKYL